MGVQPIIPSGSDYQLITGDYGLIMYEITGDHGLIMGDQRLITVDYGVITGVDVQPITGVAVPWGRAGGVTYWPLTH